jgi:hypothetical protein
MRTGLRRNMAGLFCHQYVEAESGVAVIFDGVGE